MLAVDIGTGTQDILLFEAGTVIENAVQLVMPSPTALLAERVKRATADRVDLLLTGITMGGGPDHWAVEAHLKAGLRVWATPDAARTFDDDLGRVEAMGVRIVEGAKDRGRSGVHHKDRDTAGPGAGHRAHPRHAFRDFVAEKAKPFQAGPPRDLLP